MWWSRRRVWRPGHPRRQLLDLSRTSPGDDGAYLSNPPDVLLAILGREPQVLVQPETHIVAVEPVGLQAELEQVLLEGRRDGRFARRREAGEPDGATLLLAQLAALFAREARVPGDVALGNVLVGFEWKDSRRLTLPLLLLIGMPYGC